jgi:Domain of unknown function (DUF4124)
MPIFFLRFDPTALTSSSGTKFFRNIDCQNTFPITDLLWWSLIVTDFPRIREMKWLTLVSLLLIMQGVPAQQIYKSVDKDGNVSYSSEPAKGAVEVKTVAPPPRPSPEEVERAQQRYLDLEARDAQREFERREQEQEELLRRQIREDMELKRQIANQKSGDVIVINQNPYYWGRPYQPRFHKRGKPRHGTLPGKPVGPKLQGQAGTPLYRNLGRPNRSRW